MKEDLPSEVVAWSHRSKTPASVGVPATVTVLPEALRVSPSGKCPR